MNDNILEKGIDLIRAGRLEDAARLLAKVVQNDPANDAAWVWLAECLHEPERRLYCMQQALKANPRNPIALDEIEHPTFQITSRSGEPFLPPGRPARAVPQVERREEPPPQPQYTIRSGGDPLEGLEMPQWSAATERPHLVHRKRHGLRLHLPKKLWIWVTAALAVLLLIGGAGILFTKGLFQSVELEKPQPFKERMAAFMDEAEILMAYSDGSQNLGAFNIQEQITKVAYERLLVDWPEELAYQRDEMGLAILGWESVAQISDIWAGGGGCTVTGDLLTTLMSYTGSIATDKSCDEWAAAALEMAMRHFNMARPGIESYRGK